MGMKERKVLVTLEEYETEDLDRFRPPEGT